MAPRGETLPGLMEGAEMSGYGRAVIEDLLQ
jgi:hypothetical protein